MTTLKYINNLIKNKALLVDETQQGEPVTSRIYVYKANIYYDESNDK